jgi:hypothetical protein
MHARPQLNGNTEADFGEAYMALRDAMDAINHASSMLSSNVLNSRNYQHLGQHGEDMAVDDRHRIRAALSLALAALSTLCSEISDVVLGEETAKEAAQCSS